MSVNAYVNPGLSHLNDTMPQGTEFSDNGHYGGGGSLSSGQAQDLRRRYQDPSDVHANTQNDPGQDYAYGRAQDYEKGLASNTNEEITRELGRARDDISAGMMSEGNSAISRGADPSLFRGRALEQGKRDIHQLQGQLADVALGRRAQAVGLVSSTANSRADSTRAMHLGTMAQRLAEQRANVEESESQARINEMPYDRMLKMADIAARSGFTYGGGGFTPKPRGGHAGLFG